MNRSLRRYATLLALVVSLFGTGLSLAADDYPTKPVKVVVAFSPGGGLSYGSTGAGTASHLCRFMMV